MEGGRGGAIAMICTWHAEDEEEGRQGYENHLKELKACVHQHIFRILILYPFQPLWEAMVCTLPFQIMVKNKANKGALGLMLLVID